MKILVVQVDVDDLNEKRMGRSATQFYNRPEGYIILGQRFARQGMHLSREKARRRRQTASLKR